MGKMIYTGDELPRNHITGLKVGGKASELILNQEKKQRDLLHQQNCNPAKKYTVEIVWAQGQAMAKEIAEVNINQLAKDNKYFFKPLAIVFK